MIKMLCVELKSNEHSAFGENARKRVPPSVLVQNLFEHANDKFEWIFRGVDDGISKDWFNYTLEIPQRMK